jgi:hypothetical protein
VIGVECTFCVNTAHVAAHLIRALLRERRPARLRRTLRGEQSAEGKVVMEKREEGEKI